MISILIVDDEENLRLVLETLLSKSGYRVFTAQDAESALATIADTDPDFILADIRMPGMDGIALTRTLKERESRATIIVMSAFGSVDLAVDAMKAGAYDYISKPFKQDEILLTLKKAEERLALHRENAELRAQLDADQQFAGLIGKSEPMIRLYRTVEKVADYKTTVLIQGESGTGKELVARALHARSSRKAKAFVAVNCGAIPENLLESELFGHKRGAFTDANADKRGLFSEADGGTLFLDEIGELPLLLQVKLLRVLQEETFRRLGDTKDTEVDVRIVAATVRDLSREVTEGRFREDLFYRLNVLTLHIPPLRDRREDVPLLLNHFIAKNNRRMRLDIRDIAPDARKLLLDYAWPGNVRELENLVERAMVLTESDVLGLHDLPDRLRLDPTPSAQAWMGDELWIKKTTRFIEEALIRKALKKTNGNRTQAAKILEISHRALLYKIKEYGIS